MIGQARSPVRFRSIRHARAAAWLVLLFAAGSGAYAASNVTLTLGAEHGVPGATVYVPVTLATNSNPLASLSFEIQFDSARLDFLGAEAGQIVEDAGKVVETGAVHNGAVEMLVYGGREILRDGALLALEFAVRTGISGGTVHVWSSDASAATPDGGYLDIRVGEGQIIIGEGAVITVAPNPAEVAVGSTVQLQAQSSDTADTAFTWASSDTAIADVSGEGVVTGIAAGVVSISAIGANSGAVGRTALYVVYSPLIAVTPDPVLVSVDGTMSLTAVSTAGDSSFEWASTDNSIVQVTATGPTTADLIGLAPGRIYVTALGDTSGLQGAAMVVVSVEPSVMITPETTSLYIGEETTLTATSTDVLDTAFTWWAADTAVVSVSSAGVVTGLADGSTTLTAVGNHSGREGVAVVSVSCDYLLPPTNVQASDGEYEDGVLVEWNAVPGTDVEYRVYRANVDDASQAVLLSETWQTETSFMDETADASRPGLQCRDSRPTHYYWVEASGGECVSDLSTPDDGYRLVAAAKRSGAVFPGSLSGDMAVLAAALAILWVSGRRRSSGRSAA